MPSSIPIVREFSNAFTNTTDRANDVDEPTSMQMSEDMFELEWKHAEYVNDDQMEPSDADVACAPAGGKEVTSPTVNQDAFHSHTLEIIQAEDIQRNGIVEDESHTFQQLNSTMTKETAQAAHRHAQAVSAQHAQERSICEQSVAEDTTPMLEIEEKGAKQQAELREMQMCQRQMAYSIQLCNVEEEEFQRRKEWAEAHFAELEKMTHEGIQKTSQIATKEAAQVAHRHAQAVSAQHAQERSICESEETEGRLKIQNEQFDVEQNMAEDITARKLRLLEIEAAKQEAEPRRMQVGQSLQDSGSQTSGHKCEKSVRLKKELCCTRKQLTQMQEQNNQLQMDLQYMKHLRKGERQQQQAVMQRADAVCHENTCLRAERQATAKEQATLKCGNEHPQNESKLQLLRNKARKMFEVGNIPVWCVPDANCSYCPLKKDRFATTRDFSLSRIADQIRKELTVSTLSIHVESGSPLPTSELLEDIYNSCKANDGFLHLKYSH